MTERKPFLSNDLAKIATVKIKSVLNLFQVHKPRFLKACAKSELVHDLDDALKSIYKKSFFSILVYQSKIRQLPELENKKIQKYLDQVSEFSQTAERMILNIAEKLYTSSHSQEENVNLPGFLFKLKVHTSRANRNITYINIILAKHFSQENVYVSMGSVNLITRTAERLLEPRLRTDNISEMEELGGKNELLISKSDNIPDFEIVKSIEEPVEPAILSELSIFIASSKIQISSDGKKMGCGARNGTIKVWSTETGSTYGKPFRGHRGWVNCVAFSTDGKKIVSGGDDSTVRIWNVDTGDAIGHPIKEHRGKVMCVAFSNNGKQVVSGGDDGTVLIWNTVTDYEIGKILQGHSGWARCVAFSNDEKQIVSGGDDGTVVIWNTETGNAIGKPLQGHRGRVNSVAFSNGGKQIVSGGHDGAVVMWDAETGDAIGRPMQGHRGWVNNVAFSNDGKQIVSGGHDGAVILWNAKTGHVIQKALQGHRRRVHCVSFSNDGRQIISGGDDGTVLIWNAETSDAIGNPLRGHSGWVSCVAFCKDGKQIVSGGWDGTVRIWDAETSDAIGKPLRGHRGWVKCVGFSNDGKKIVSGGHDGIVRIWNAETGDEIGKPLQGHRGWVHCVAFSNDGEKIVSGGHDGTVMIWNAQTGHEIGIILQGHRDWVRCVTFSNDGMRIACGGDDGTVRIWNAETGDASGNPLQGHRGWVRCVAFSNDGKQIVSGGHDGAVVVWDAEAGNLIGKPFQGHRSWVDSVAFSNDGEQIVSGGHDGTVVLWNYIAGLAFSVLARNNNRIISSVGFLNDKELFLLDSDGAVEIWSVKILEILGNEEAVHEKVIAEVLNSNSIDIGGFKKLLDQITEDQGIEFSNSDLQLFNIFEDTTAFGTKSYDLQMSTTGICVRNLQSNVKMPSKSPYTWHFKYGNDKKREVMVEPSLLTPFGFSVLFWIIQPRPNTISALIWCMNLVTFPNCLIQEVVKKFEEFVSYLGEEIQWIVEPNNLLKKEFAPYHSKNENIVVPRTWLNFLGIDENFVKIHGEYADFAARVSIFTNLDQIPFDKDPCARRLREGTEWLFVDDDTRKLTYGKKQSNGIEYISLGASLSPRAGLEVKGEIQFRPFGIDFKREKFDHRRTFDNLAHFVSYPLHGSSQKTLVRRMRWLKCAFEDAGLFPEGDNQSFLKAITGNACNVCKPGKIFQEDDCSIGKWQLNADWHVGTVREVRTESGCTLYFLTDESNGKIYQVKCREEGDYAWRVDGDFEEAEELPDGHSNVSRNLI